MKTITSLTTITLIATLAFVMVGTSYQQAFADAVYILIDESGSINSTNYDLEKNGTAAGLQAAFDASPGAFGNFEVGVARFGSTVTEEVPLTLISNQGILDSVKSDIIAMPKGGGGTCMSCAIDLATAALIANPFGDALINLITDGAPNSQSATTNSTLAAEAAGVDGLSAIGVGASNSTLTFLNVIAYPEPSLLLMMGDAVPDPTVTGFVIAAGNFDEFEDAITAKIMAEIRMDSLVAGEFLPIDNSALLLAGFSSIAIWMVPAVAGMAGVGIYLGKYRAHKN